MTAVNYLGHPCSIADLAERWRSEEQARRILAEDPRIHPQRLAELSASQVERTGRIHDVLNLLGGVADQLDDAGELQATLAALTEYALRTANEAFETANRVLVALQHEAAAGGAS
jgi:hypothetical protein